MLSSIILDGAKLGGRKSRWAVVLTDGRGIALLLNSRRLAEVALEQPLDDDDVPPDAVEFGVPLVGAHLAEAE